MSASWDCFIGKECLLACAMLQPHSKLISPAPTKLTKMYDNLIIRYVADVVIATPASEYHIKRLDEQFECTKMVSLNCKVSAKYVGKMVDKHVIRPDRDAVEAVLTWKSSNSKQKMMIFLGFAKFYRETLKGYADKVYSMQQLMSHKGKKFTWNDAAEKSSQRIKRELGKSPVLRMPTENGMYFLYTDASVVAILGILHQ